MSVLPDRNKLATPALSKGKGKPTAPRPAWSRMQSTTRSRGRCSFTESNYSLGDWHVPLGYDYSKSTTENYQSRVPINHVSEYQSVRATRDHAYHGSYTRERQLFQGDFAGDEMLRCLYGSVVLLGRGDIPTGVERVVGCHRTERKRESKKKHTANTRGSSSRCAAAKRGLCGVKCV